jgi:hypothetical protein
MLGSYAAHDHRANGDQAKKACIGVSRGRYQVIAVAGLMDICTRRLSTVRYRGRSTYAIGSL